MSILRCSACRPHSLDFSGLAAADGTARVARVTLDRVRVDDIMVRDVPALVAERGTLGTACSWAG